MHETSYKHEKEKVELTLKFIDQLTHKYNVNFRYEHRATFNMLGEHAWYYNAPVFIDITSDFDVMGADREEAMIQTTDDGGLSPRSGAPDADESSEEEPVPLYRKTEYSWKEIMDKKRSHEEQMEKLRRTYAEKRRLAAERLQQERRDQAKAELDQMREARKLLKEDLELKARLDKERKDDEERRRRAWEREEEAIRKEQGGLGDKRRSHTQGARIESRAPYT